MSPKPELSKLLQPGKIGTLHLKNRIIMPPMATSFASIMGESTDTLLEYLRARARGGAGLIFTETALVATVIDRLRQLACMLRIDDDGFVPPLFELVEALHQAGAKAGIQLSPGMASQARGASWDIGSTEAVPGVGPSGVTHPEIGKPARELTLEEIGKIVKLFGMAAARAKGAGFDVIEIHAHSGFLTGQFLSPYFNKRADKYGGSPEKRFRFLAEIIEETRKQVGSDYPLTVKFSIDEFLEGGRTLKEGQDIARALEKAGINAITISSGIHGVRLPSMPSMYHPDAAFLPLAAAVREAVSLPIILPGKLGDPALAERVLKEGKADFVAWGRPLIADPELPRKVAEGRVGEVRRCLFCNECIRVQWAYKAPLRCTVNPVAGREARYGTINPAPVKKKVVVVGAGPAGMEAARVAALRGHEVIIYEKSGELGGGQLRLAAIPAYKDVLGHIARYYAAAFKPLPVNIVLGKNITASAVLKNKPDAVIVATGAGALVPDVPGINGQNVVTAHDYLAGKEVKGKTVIVVGGGSVGCEVAGVIAGRGRQVTVVEMLDAVATDVHAMVKIGLMKELSERGVKIMTGLKMTAVTGRGVEVTGKNGKQVLEADLVVLALGARSSNELGEKLRGKVKELYVIGDARQPGRIRDAVSEGYAVAFEI